MVIVSKCPYHGSQRMTEGECSSCYRKKVMAKKPENPRPSCQYINGPIVVSYGRKRKRLRKRTRICKCLWERADTVSGVRIAFVRVQRTLKAMVPEILAKSQKIFKNSIHALLL